MSVSVVMVAEKPMLAKSIARLLSDNKATERKGWNGACSVSEYAGTFQGKSAKFKVTSTCGHVMSLDFPMKYNNWDRTDPVDLYAAPTNKIEANSKLKMNDYLASEARGADYLILWLDCDKEGENICFEVIEAVESVMRKPRSGDFMEVVYRAHFSAITEKDIKAAMKNLGRPNKNEAMSVDARQELDLRVGCSFTRFQTKYFQGKYGDLDSTVISYGPCQTPTLGFCVTRHDQITQFTPEPYWVLNSRWTVGEQSVRLEWERGRIFDKDVAQLFLERIKRKGTAVVSSVTMKEGRKERPQALNTVELMRVGSSALGLSPATTMHVAEQLYTQGYISYPRTETTAYPKNFDIEGTLRAQSSDNKWGAVVRTLLSEGIRKPRAGEDKGDHPPITPMRPAGGQLSGDMARIYDYVAQHFIASLMGPCIYEITTIKVECGDEIFKVQGRTTIDKGFTEIMSWLEVDEGDSSVPQLQKGDVLKLAEGSLAARETSAPGYLTESELISLMEKHGIGTDASIPVHINTITQRNYVTVESGRRLVPTRLGIALVHGYWTVDRELVLPTMRAELETQLTLIAQGKADFHDVKNHALEMFRQKFIYYVKSISMVDSLLEVSFTSLSEAGKPFSKCGKCNRFMKLVESRPQRLYCPTCQETYSVPTSRDGQLRLFGDAQCPIDGFQLVYWQGTGGKLARSFALCPFCYNSPPFERMKEADGCDRCSHPSCSFSYITSGICGCLRECGGVMVVDPKSGPKWRAACNRCPAVLGLFDGAHRLRVKEDECPHCSSRIVAVDYKDKSPLPNGENSLKTCIFCNEDIKELVSLHHAFRTEEDQQKQALAMRGRGRGRGRARGRGGRGSRGGNR